VKVRMLVSVVEMPGMRLREVGQVYDVPDEVGAQWCASRLALPEPASVDTQTVEPPETTEAPANRRRKEKRST